MTILDNYWPNLTNIQQCIRTEAETTEDAVLLAVHEPGPLRVRAANGSAEETRTEQDLLEALLRPADDGSAVVVAITGDSGVGKSHMVRWLHAQLQRHPSRERLVIVLRFPGNLPDVEVSKLLREMGWSEVEVAETLAADGGKKIREIVDRTGPLGIHTVGGVGNILNTAKRKLQACFEQDDRRAMSSLRGPNHE